MINQQYTVASLRLRTNEKKKTFTYWEKRLLFVDKKVTHKDGVVTNTTTVIKQQVIYNEAAKRNSVMVEQHCH